VPPFAAFPPTGEYHLRFVVLSKISGPSAATTREPARLSAIERSAESGSIEFGGGVVPQDADPPGEPTREDQREDRQNDGERGEPETRRSVRSFERWESRMRFKKSRFHGNSGDAPAEGLPFA